MKKIISMFLLALSILCIGTSYEQKDLKDLPVRTIDLHNNASIGEIKKRLIDEVDNFEMFGDEATLGVSFSMTYSMARSNISNSTDEYKQDVFAFYDILNNMYHVDFVVESGEEKYEINYDLVPIFEYNESEDIAFEIDEEIVLMSDFFLQDSTENLCSVCNVTSGSINKRTFQLATNCCLAAGGGGGVILIFAIIVEPLVEGTYNFFVDVATTIVEHVTSFFAWISTLINGNTTTAEPELEYRFSLNGVEYVIKAVTVGAVAELSKTAYFLALVDYDGKVYLSTIAVDENTAASALKSGSLIDSAVPPNNPNVASPLKMTLSTYTWDGTNARRIADAASVGGISDDKDGYGSMKDPGLYFRHFHPTIYGVRTHAHSLYGTPILVG